MSDTASSSSSSSGTDSVPAQDDDLQEPGPELPSPASPRDEPPTVSEPSLSANVEDQSSDGDLPDAGNGWDNDLGEATGPMHVDWQAYVRASRSDSSTSSLNTGSDDSTSSLNIE